MKVFLLFLSIQLFSCSSNESDSISSNQKESVILDSLYNEFMQFHFGFPEEFPDTFMYRLSAKDQTLFSWNKQKDINEFDILLIDFEANIGAVIFDKKNEVFYSDFEHFVGRYGVNYVENHLKQYYKSKPEYNQLTNLSEDAWDIKVLPHPSSFELLRGVELYINQTFNSNLIQPDECNRLITTYFQFLYCEQILEEEIFTLFEQEIEKSNQLLNTHKNIEIAQNNYINQINWVLQRLKQSKNQYTNLFTWQNHLIYTELVHSNFKSLDYSKASPDGGKYNYSLIIKMINPPGSIISFSSPK